MSSAISTALKQAETLPAHALVALFSRYGKPLAAPPNAIVPYAESVRIDSANGPLLLRAYAIRMPVDVIANDWFALEQDGGETLIVPGPLFVAALQALRAAAERG